MTSFKLDLVIQNLEHSFRSMADDYFHIIVDIKLLDKIWLHAVQ